VELQNVPLEISVGMGKEQAAESLGSRKWSFHQTIQHDSMCPGYANANLATIYDESVPANSWRTAAKNEIIFFLFKLALGL
jgi:hypothetical protein